MKLDKIYEEIVLKSKHSPDGYDIWFDDDINDTKIQYFFDRLFEKNVLFELFSNDGDINIVFEKQPWKNGLAFKYENVSNNTKFYTSIILFKAINYSKKIENDILDGLRQNKDVSKLKEIKTILNNNPNNQIMGFRFEDENQLTHLTGKMQNKAATIFGFVYRNIKHVMLQYNNISMFYCLVKKSENKRINLYKEIIKRTVKPTSYYLDDITDNDYYILYFW